jgi:transposase
MPGGRPTRYRKTYAQKAYNFCRNHGFTDTELAEMFDVSKQTINTWKQKHPKFLDSIRAGKDEFDSNNVEKCLLRRAQGFEYEEITREMRGAIDVKTGEGKLSITREVTKHVIPSVEAEKLWLINRQPHRWRDKQLHELTGPDGGPIIYQPIDRYLLPEEVGPPAEKSPKDPSP